MLLILFYTILFKYIILFLALFVLLLKLMCFLNSRAKHMSRKFWKRIQQELYCWGFCASQYGTGDACTVMEEERWALSLSVGNCFAQRCVSFKLWVMNQRTCELESSWIKWWIPMQRGLSPCLLCFSFWVSSENSFIYRVSCPANLTGPNRLRPICCFFFSVKILDFAV